MADALLGIVIENLGSFVREELATFLGVEELTQRLSRNLTAIRVVLKDAEEKQITSHAMKDWLQKLTDAAHVLDDILDECSIATKANGGNKGITCFHPMKILARRDIGKRMKKVAKNIDVVAEERKKFELGVGVMEHRSEDDEWRQTTSVIAEPKVYGRDRDIEQVVKFLLRHASDSEELSVYSIVGHGGYGKTTLAQLVFNDERVSNHFDLKIWVCVSDDFSMTKILQSIVESTNGKNPDLSSLESMQKKVQEILQSKRYLLVLDDVWNEDQEKWNKLKYLLQRGNGTKGASILVTTRLEVIATIMGTYSAHHLVGLFDDDVWFLFEQYAFEPNREERADLVAIGKEIVRKCVGSPLAVKVLGSLLRFKREECQWLSIKESKFWNLYADNPIMSALRLSYFNLKLSWRPCFSFCAVFPKDFVMVKEDLIHLWMANGFISSRGNLEVEHVGNEVWNELYQRSFFQEVKTDEKGNITFKMHDLVHDLAQFIMGDECVVSVATSLTNLSSRVHHIGRLDDNQGFDYHMIPFNKVESLRTFLEFDPPFENYHTLPSITPLRALRTSCFQLSTLKSLTHLRYLELCKSSITTLPECVCRLQKLQILKLEWCCDLSSLPQQLTQLQDLRHLVIRDCNSLVSMPSKIGELTCLKTLSIFIVDSKTGFGLAELHNLQLRGKLHIKGLENVPNEGDARQANLIGKKDLNRLYLSWGGYADSQGSGTDAEQVLEALEPHSGLISFGMKGYGGIHFPHWMRNTSIVKGLVDVILYDCKNCERLPTLGKLPCLTTLFLSGMRDVKYIDDDLYEPVTEKAFVSLKKLTLRGLPNLEGILEAEGVEMLPQLSYLSISGVPKLAIPSLPSVEILRTFGKNEELLKSLSDCHCNEDVASFPGGIVCNMHNLKELYIGDSDKIKVLPDELSTLSALEELHISSCHELESLSEHMLQGLSSLRTLKIWYCQKFKCLSEVVGHLTCLESLEIACCPQLVLPSNMDRLTALRHVGLSGEDKNGMILEGLERIPSLQILALSDFPSLTSLPERLKHIPSLQILALSNCPSLTSLPDWLGAMTSLRKLQIYDCPELSSLPDNFQQLRNLHELRISRCPKLQKACKERTGKDWPKIAHIRDRNVDAEPEPAFWDKMISLSKMVKRRLPRRRFNYTAGYQFDSMVDELS